MLNEEQFLDGMLTGTIKKELDSMKELIKKKTSLFKSKSTKSKNVSRVAALKLQRKKNGLFDKNELVKWTLGKNIVANALSGATQLLVSFCIACSSCSLF